MNKRFIFQLLFASFITFSYSAATDHQTTFTQAKSYFSEGKVEQAISLCKSTLETAEKTGDITIQIKAYRHLGEFYYRTDFYGLARKEYNKGLRLLVKTPDFAELLHILGGLGAVEYWSENHAMAQQYFAHALSLLPEKGAATEKATLLSYLSAANLKLGEKEKALRQATKAVHLTLTQITQNPSSDSLRYTLAGTYQALGDVERAQGNFQQADKIYTKALESLKKHTDNIRQARILFGLGQSKFQQNAINEALGYIEKSLSFFDAAKDRRGQADCFHTLAKILLKKKETQKAALNYKIAYGLYHDVRVIPKQKEVAQALTNLTFTP